MAEGRVEHLVLTALFLGPFGNIQRVLVDVVIVVTVFRRVQAVAAQRFVTFKVGQQRIADLLKGVFLLFEHQLADRRHRVDVGRQTGENQPRTVVDHRAAGGDIFAALHAAFDQQRHQRLRRHIAVDALADDGADSRQAHDMGDLLFHRRVECFEGAQVVQIAGVQPLIAIEQHHPPAVKHELDSDRPLGVAGGGPLVDAPGFLRLNAAHQAVIAGVFKIEAFAQHHLDVGVIEVAGREAHSRFHHVDDFFHVFLRRLVVDTAGQRRLVNLHEAHGVHNQIGQIVTGIAAATFLAANGEVDKRLITREIFRSQFARHPHQFGTFDDKRLQQLQCGVVGQAAFADIGFEHWIAVLVDAPQRQPGLVLFDFKQ